MQKYNRNLGLTSLSLLLYLTVFIGIGFAGYTYWTKDVKEERWKEIYAWEDLMDEWHAAEKFAESTSRIQLAIPMKDLIDIRGKINSFKAEGCVMELIPYATAFTGKKIDAYQAFMRNETNAEEFTEASRLHTIYLNKSIECIHKLGSM